ncbi:putative toxin-antitoxin system toxin component, PIN family [Asinibacterium sp. OR53]|jgi:putative PIN family toxin of toxin-antitoxin system|uniref:putative toxin-antitoxin system toxin component, PIN family n=1 Tax=Asinibacterium sp. OR53 TaxID=925409 RepID=UPI00041F9769|nr:putative toxin-antitoxin system toxin component, PIN family [Asinibacterium sp. OR53]
MPSKRDKIILDTNLWISFLLTSNFSKLDKLIANKSIIILFSQTLLNEFIEVAQRPKFKKYFTLSDLEELLFRIHTEVLFVHVVSDVAICRDPKDNFLLSLAKDGKATHLITGDKDLLDIKVFGKTKIVTIADYLTKK